MKNYNTIQEVKDAVNAGITVNWQSGSYYVKKDNDGEHVVKCTDNSGQELLTEAFKATDFFTNEENETTYYIFGEEACRELSENGFEYLLQQWEAGEINLAKFEFIEGVTKSVEFAEAFSGAWYSYAIVSKEEYNRL